MCAVSSAEWFALNVQCLIMWVVRCVPCVECSVLCCMLRCVVLCVIIVALCCAVCLRVVCLRVVCLF